MDYKEYLEKRFEMKLEHERESDRLRAEEARLQEELEKKIKKEEEENDRADGKKDQAQKEYKAAKITQESDKKGEHHLEALQKSGHRLSATQKMELGRHRGEIK